MGTVVFYVDEVGSKDPGSLESSVFASCAVSGTSDSIRGLEQDIRDAWDRAILLKDLEARKAKSGDLDTFTSILKSHKVNPTVAYARHDAPGFSEKYRQKVSRINSESQAVRDSTGINKQVFPDKGYSPSTKIWIDVTGFVIGTGVVVHALRKTSIDQLEIHLDEVTLKKESASLLHTALKTIIPNGIRDVIKPALAKEGKTVDHITNADIPVEVDFRGTSEGRFAASYLTTIAYRALNTFATEKRNASWLNQLIKNQREVVVVDTTDTLLARWDR